MEEDVRDILAENNRLDELIKSLGDIKGRIKDLEDGKGLTGELDALKVKVAELEATIKEMGDRQEIQGDYMVGLSKDISSLKSDFEIGMADVKTSSAENAGMSTLF